MEGSQTRGMPPRQKIEKGRERKGKYSIETKRRGIVTSRNCEGPVLVPLVISHDGAVHSDTVRRWKIFSPDIKVDWVRMAQSVLRFDVVIVGRFFNKCNWVSEAWRRPTQRNLKKNQKDLLRESQQLRREERSYVLNLALGAMWVCGHRARHLHTALG